jgi:hypothetical protein
MNTMYRDSSGMKRSLQCTDLTAMHSKSNHLSLVDLMDMNAKFWDDKSSLAGEVSSKKRRIAPPTTDESPATKALEQFLLYASDEVQLSMAMPLGYDFAAHDSDDSSYTSSCSSKSSCSKTYKSKSNFSFQSMHMHDITRGMAEISHH